MTVSKTYFEKVLDQLRDIGLLHLSGDEIPSVRELLTGRRSKGSWWADPAAQKIFNVNQALEDHPDVTIVKLISKKVTFVHRKLWLALLSASAARDEWQVKNLSKPAQLLLNEIDKDGTLFTNSVKRSFATKIGDAARDLELRLLIHSDQFHTESGAHAKRLETWEAWAKRVNLKGRRLNSIDARYLLEKHLDAINQTYSGRGRLPWTSSR
jgi:hypothetical protein